MIIRTLQGLLLAVLLVLLAGALYLHFSARAALDENFRYTADTSRLPLFSPSSPNGLVRISANDMEFRARTAGFDGDPDKPAVVLLHGFPVTSAMYRDLIPALAAAGYRVLAPDQRGYSPGARPGGSDNYRVDKLAGDVIALADAAGFDRFHLVGHDWGAVVAWSVVLTYPERVKSLGALSIAHPAAFLAALENDPDQKARSRYFVLFAIPWLAESIFAMRDFAAVQWMHDAMAPEQAREYLAMLREPGALTATLNWYRANLSGNTPPVPDTVEVYTPTLFVWGNRDEAVGRYSVQQQASYMKGPYREIELDAGHWLLSDERDRTVGEIVGHIDSYAR